MKPSDNLPQSVRDALVYLKTGGLAEVSGIADAALRSGLPKVASDTDLAVALCILALAGLDREESDAEGLTIMQVKVFGFVKDYIGEHGISPTISQITAGIGGFRGSVHTALHELQRKGKITMEPHRARSIKIVRPRHG